MHPEIGTISNIQRAGRDHSPLQALSTRRSAEATAALRWRSMPEKQVDYRQAK
jgi:hypothetical protein